MPEKRKRRKTAKRSILRIFLRYTYGINRKPGDSVKNNTTAVIAGFLYEVYFGMAGEKRFEPVEYSNISF